MDDIRKQSLESLMALLHSGNNRVAYEACKVIEDLCEKSARRTDTRWNTSGCWKAITPWRGTGVWRWWRQCQGGTEAASWTRR